MKQDREKYYKELKSVEKPTKCKCPRCGDMHKKLMLWTGTTFPLKFCPNCQRVFDHMSGNMDAYTQDSDGRITRHGRSQ